MVVMATKKSTKVYNTHGYKLTKKNLKSLRQILEIHKSKSPFKKKETHIKIRKDILDSMEKILNSFSSDAEGKNNILKTSNHNDEINYNRLTSNSSRKYTQLTSIFYALRNPYLSKDTLERYDDILLDMLPKKNRRKSRRTSSKQYTNKQINNLYGDLDDIQNKSKNNNKHYMEIFNTEEEEAERGLEKLSQLVRDKLAKENKLRNEKHKEAIERYQTLGKSYVKLLPNKSRHTSTSSNINKPGPIKKLVKRKSSVTSNNSGIVSDINNTNSTTA